MREARQGGRSTERGGGERRKKMRISERMETGGSEGIETYMYYGRHPLTEKERRTAKRQRESNRKMSKRREILMATGRGRRGDDDEREQWQLSSE
jgi:hypothetical protein